MVPATGSVAYRPGQPVAVTVIADAAWSAAVGRIPSGAPRYWASAPTTWVMQAHSAATSSGSMAGNMAMRNWLRPSLR